jgi:hypothetical protein
MRKYFITILSILPILAYSQHSLNLNYNRGNNVRSSEDFMADYSFQYMDSTTKNTFEASVNFLYGKQEQDINARDLSISLRERLYFGSVEGFMNLQNDQSLARGIENRVMGGVGLEKFLYRKNGFYFSISDGALFEMTKYSDLGEFVKVRNSFRAQIKNKGKVKFRTNVLIQNNIQDWSDLILTSNTTLGMPISSMIDFTANYMFLKETFVSKKLDFFTLGIEVNF